MSGTADRPARSRRYRSLSNFYRGEPRRMASRERDFGLWWRDGISGPLHRAAWIFDTGELYTVRLGPGEDGAGEGEVLGGVEGEVLGGGEVEVLAVAAEADEIERALRGWRGASTRPDSLSWLRGRAAALAPAAGPRPAPDAPRSAANVKLAALLSALIVGISPAGASAQNGRGRVAYPRQSPSPVGRASRSGEPPARTREPPRGTQRR
jgi:hypothetical protein